MDAGVSHVRTDVGERLLVGASGRRVPPTGGVILARSGDVEALRTEMAKDPFVADGAATFEIVEFTPSMTAPGAEVFKSL
jgi:uncharacterized protein YciI